MTLTDHGVGRGLEGGLRAPAVEGGGGRRRRLSPVVAVAVAVVVVGVGLVVVSVVGGGGRGGLRVGAEVPVTAVNQIVGPANNSPELVADPTDPRFVVLANRTDAPDFGCGLEVSGDGGRSWVGAQGPKLPAGAEKCYGPEVAFDGRGVLYFLFVGLAGNGNSPMGAFLTSTGDRARTFSSPRPILGPLNFAVRMAIDPDLGPSGRIHLAWLHATSTPGLGSFGPPPNPILTAYSDDGGRTFSSPLQVSDPGRERVVAPALSLGPDHRVYVAYYDLGRDAVDYEGLDGPIWEGTWSVVLAASTDGGAHFAPGVMVDDSIAPPGRVMLIFTMPPPSLVADATRVCAAWTDSRFGDPDALLRCSGDGGRTWEALQRLNDDPVGNGKDQELPRLAFSPRGRLDAIFLDRRRDIFNQSYDVMYTDSTDGGRHFGPNIRMTTESSDVGIGAQYDGPAAAGLVEHGSRLALLSRASGALAAWPDARNATALQMTEQDILAISIRLPGSQHSRRWAWAGGMLVVGGLLLAVWGARRRRQVTRLDEAAADGRRTAGTKTPAAASRGGRRNMALGATAVVVVVVTIATYQHLLGSPTNGGPLPPSPPVVDVTIRDHHYDYRGPVTSGRVIFRIYNATRIEHRLGLYPLPESFPPIDAQLHGSVRRSLPPALAELSNVKPGQTHLAAVDLAPHQRYAMLDFLRAPDQQIYALKGLDSEFRAR